MSQWHSGSSIEIMILPAVRASVGQSCASGSEPKQRPCQAACCGCLHATDFTKHGQDSIVYKKVKTEIAQQDHM